LLGLNCLQSFLPLLEFVIWQLVHRRVIQVLPGDGYLLWRAFLKAVGLGSAKAGGDVGNSLSLVKLLHLLR